MPPLGTPHASRRTKTNAAYRRELMNRPGGEDGAPRACRLRAACGIIFGRGRGAWVVVISRGSRAGCADPGEVSWSWRSRGFPGRYQLGVAEDDARHRREHPERRRSENLGRDVRETKRQDSVVFSPFRTGTYLGCGEKSDGFQTTT